MTLKEILFPKVLALVAMSFTLASSAHGQVTAFDNFGPGDSFLPDAFTLQGNDAAGGRKTAAMAFTPSVSGTVYSVTIALDFGFDFKPVNVELSHALLGPEWTPDWKVGSDDWGAPYLFLPPNPLIYLQAGHTYWLHLWTSEESQLYWGKSPLSGQSGPVATYVDADGVWHQTDERQGAFRVEVMPTAVPEASSLTLLTGTAPLGFMWWWKRRRRAP